jgi:hypothetical protein
MLAQIQYHFCPKPTLHLYETTLLSPKFVFALHRRHLDGLTCLMCLGLGGIYSFFIYIFLCVCIWVLDITPSTSRRAKATCKVVTCIYISNKDGQCAYDPQKLVFIHFC